MFKILKELRFTRSDMRGAVTIAILIIAVVVILALNKIGNSKERSRELNEQAAKALTTTYSTEKARGMASDKVSEDISKSSAGAIEIFDPNTVSLKELLTIGFTKSQALSLLRYRAAGKVFRIKEEVIGCHGISDSLYFAIEPYIAIGEEFRYQPKSYNNDTSTAQQRKQSGAVTREQSAGERDRIEPSPFLIDTVTAKYLTAIGALTPRQAEVFVKWRDISGIENLEELKSCYTVSDSVANYLARYAIFTPRKAATRESEPSTAITLTELNSADSAALVALYGIGAKSAVAILEYRERLGGFYSKEQLSEVKIITEGNFEKIITQIYLNNSDISKIDVNFATAKQLSRHPYFTPLKIRRLLKIRELKGGWRSTEEMIEDDIFTKEEAQRVHPYLHFEVLNPL